MSMVSCQGCAATNGVKMMFSESAANPHEDKCFIVVGSSQLANFAILKDPAHNYLTFFKNEGGQSVEIFGLNGAATNRNDNQNFGGIGGSQHGLFATTQITGSKDGDNFVTEIACGDFDWVMKKARIALDASYMINRQNLRYEMFSFFHGAQNSNAVNYSLLRAMDLNMPEQNERRYMMPGNGFSLLPRGWRSIYEDWEPPFADREFQEWHIQQLAEEMMAHKAEMCCMPIAENDERRFNARRPFAKYEPLKVADVEQKWLAEKARRAANEMAAAETAMPSIEQLAIQP